MIELDNTSRTIAEPGTPIDTAVVYVGFWIRFWASVVDSLLLMLVIVPVGWFVFGTTQVGTDHDLLHFVTSTVLPAMVVLIFWARTQTTPGKALFHARIVDAETGHPPTTPQLLVRYLGYYVSLFGLGLGFLWVVFDARKQGWHDKMAGTVVVRDRART